MNRFIQQDKLMSIAIGCGEQVGSRGLSGKENDFAIGENALDRDGEIDAAHSRQDHIRDQHLRRHQQRGFEGGIAVVSRNSGISAARENFRERVRDTALIIDHHDDGAVAVAFQFGSWERNFMEWDGFESVRFIHGIHLCRTP